MFLGKLNKRQLGTLSEYFARMSLLLFGALVIPIFLNFNLVNTFNAVYGIILSTIALFISLFLIRKNEHKY